MALHEGESMMRLLVLVSLLAATAIAPAQTSDEHVLRELARLQGVWQPIRLERKGEFVEDAFRPAARIVIHKSTLLLQVDHRTLLELHFRIDTGRSPKVIDLTCCAEETRGQVLRGIYSLNGDLLTLCWPLAADADRPRILLDAPDKDHATFTLRRMR